MAFEEGVCATDVPALKKMGLPLDKVARLISSVFCEQVRFLFSLPPPSLPPSLPPSSHGLYKT
jgi:hypothetical protein